jgi:hypothetical protein
MSLANCYEQIDNATRNLLLAFAQNIVAWCYDNGRTLNGNTIANVYSNYSVELTQHMDCLSGAMLRSVTDDVCFNNDVIPPNTVVSANAISIQQFNIAKLLNNFIGKYAHNEQL